MVFRQQYVNRLNVFPLCRDNPILAVVVIKAVAAARVVLAAVAALAVAVATLHLEAALLDLTEEAESRQILADRVVQTALMAVMTLTIALATDPTIKAVQILMAILAVAAPTIPVKTLQQTHSIHIFTQTDSGLYVPNRIRAT